MDARTQAQLFEPFFTTKEKGKGTGLGLAMVYGIVKQHDGSIRVYSEPGKGTTMKLYFPALETDADIAEAKRAAPVNDLRGVETIMLVENNDMARELIQTILEEQGYTVLLAENGNEALSVLWKHDGPAHLLLTDVVMPNMNGRELYARVCGKYPGIKALYMSGYTENAIVHHGVLDEGVAFIQKPFSVLALAARVRELLDG
ncbi:MAG: response regulator [Candidatus Sumerlaeota bacterium]|nr:response regulator [Candidatus Sumerlaeota bacterium]